MQILQTFAQLKNACCEINSVPLCTAPMPFRKIRFRCSTNIITKSASEQLNIIFENRYFKINFEVFMYQNQFYYVICSLMFTCIQINKTKIII
jgi:hypothetical protein